MFEWTALVASALVVGVAKAGFGSGVGIVAVPLMGVAIGSERMLGVLLPVLIVGDLFSVVHYVRLKSVRNLCMLLAGCVVGIAGGVFALDWFRSIEPPGRGAQVLDAVVGGLCVTFVGLQAVLMFRRSRTGSRGARPAADCASGPAPGPPETAEPPAFPPAPSAPYRPAIWQGVLVGAVAGVASTLCHAAGPIIAMFLLAQRMDRRVFVGTSAWFYLGTNLMKLGPFVATGIVDLEAVSYLPYLAPAVVLGTFLGVWMNRRIPARAFSLVIYVFVLVTGIKLVSGVF